MALTGPSRRLTVIGVTYIADLAGSAPAGAPPDTARAVFLILVRVGLLCGGTVIATDCKRAASRFCAKAMSTQRSKSSAALVWLLMGLDGRAIPGLSEAARQWPRLLGHGGGLHPTHALRHLHRGVGIHFAHAHGLSPQV